MGASDDITLIGGSRYDDICACALRNGYDLVRGEVVLLASGGERIEVSIERNI